jgi:predicted N-acyltransferase
VLTSAAKVTVTQKDARPRYTSKVFSSILQVPAEDWSRVCRSQTPSVFMEAPFLLAVERTLQERSRFWHVILYDEHSQPVACSSLCTFSVDLLTLASPAVKATVAAVRQLLPSFGQVTILFCGLPVSAGQSHLVVIPGADATHVLMALNDAMTILAHREHAWFTVYKEFDSAAVQHMDFLLQLGYRRGECPAMHELRVGYPDFDSYCAALRSHYRQDVRRSQKKFQLAGLRAVLVTDSTEIERLYTSELHRQYEAVVAKAEIKLELLPRSFFLELARCFPSSISLTLIYQADRVVAFNWGLMAGRVHHYLFCGMDYSIQHADLYFNLMYHQLDAALHKGPALIQVGQTADSFKARLGCEARPLWLYIRGVGRIAAIILGASFRYLLPARPPIPKFSIFKAGAWAKGTATKRASLEAGQDA